MTNRRVEDQSRARICYRYDYIPNWTTLSPITITDFWFGSSKTFARFFCYFEFAELPISENTPLTSPSFRVDLPRTVSGSVCLNVEKMAPFVNIFDI